MAHDITVTPGSGNVFFDTGLPDPPQHLLKAQIVVMIANTIRLRNLTQTAAAKQMGIAQPDVSQLLRGRFEGFSLERLLGFLMKLGHNVTIGVEPANENAPEGHLTLGAVGS